MYTPEQLARSIEKIQTYGEEIDRDMSDVSFGLFIFAGVHEDNDIAIKYAADQLSVQYSQDFSQLVHKYALAGDPDRCQARLREYVDAGASLIIAPSVCPEDYIDTNLQMIADEVMPAFR